MQLFTTQQESEFADKKEELCPPAAPGVKMLSTLERSYSPSRLFSIVDVNCNHEDSLYSIYFYSNIGLQHQISHVPYLGASQPWYRKTDCLRGKETDEGTGHKK